MTCIAYDGRTLAGDRMTTSGSGHFCGFERKVFRLKVPGGGGAHALLGCGGCTAYTSAFRLWMLGGVEPPNVLDQQWQLILVDPRGHLWQRTNTAPIWDRIYLKQWAIGAGCDYALGAMRAGLDARQAVIVSSQYHRSVGGRVDSVRL